MTHFPTSTEFRRQAQKAMSLQLGMATPLWMVFGAAASAGVAWWWMTRAWRPTNLEAQAAQAAKTYEMADAPAASGAHPAKPKAKKRKEAGSRVEPMDPGEDVAVAEEIFVNADSAGYPRIAEEPHVPPQARTAKLEAHIPAESAETPAKAGYPVVAPGPEAADAADDLTRLVGVGPRIAAALAERGVTRFAQLAKWTGEDLAGFDEALNLRGRATRSDWVDQARRIAAPN